MKVEGNIQLRNGGPEASIVGNVVVNRRIRNIFLREAVDQGSFEAEFFDAAYQFTGCRIGILHWERGKGRKPSRVSGDSLGHAVVGAL